MTFNATLLGISSSVPVNDRNHTSLAVKYDSELILFDCGESAQQQLMKSVYSYMDISKIFISHFHADHFLGLPGLIATMSLNSRKNDLHIFGPKGIRKRLVNILKLFEINPLFKIIYKELKEGLVYSNDKYEIHAKHFRHGLENYGFVMKEKDIIGKFVKEKAFALGLPESNLYSELKAGRKVKYNNKIITPDMVMDYTFVKKGKSLGYIVDLNDKNYSDFIKNLDLLFHESMFLEKDRLQAKKHKHSVVTDVANIAKQANVKSLVLMNFSARYHDLAPMLKEARKIFKNSILGEELKVYKLKD